MLGRLRAKFILINMALVTLVLLIVFLVICFSSYRRQVDDSENALRHAMGKGFDMPADKPRLGPRQRGDKPPPMLPVIVVKLSSQGEIVSLSAPNAQVSDEVAAQAVEQALGAGKKQGVLPGLELRFLLQETPSGKQLAFVSTASERDTMQNLLLTSLLVGGGGMVAFFFISVFLSGWALRPVEKTWERQRQFVADASHELKTPLTVILANTGILLSHKGDTVASQVKWVEYTAEEANRMKKLVEDLLFLAKSDSVAKPEEKKKREPEAVFSLSDAVLSGALPFESVLFEGGLDFDCRAEPGLHMAGDQAQISRLTAALLDNACKYAGESGRVRVVLERAGADKARLCVSNTGTPIPAEHLPHLFERFYRVDKARSRDMGGYGLGLSIVKSIVDTHRGKIAVQSSPQETLFTVTLPLKELPAGEKNQRS